MYTRECDICEEDYHTNKLYKVTIQRLDSDQVTFGVLCRECCLKHDLPIDYIDMISEL